MQTVWNHVLAALPKNWQQILAWIVIFVSTTIGAHFGWLPANTPLPPPPAPLFEPSEAQANGGWKRDPEAVKVVAAGLNFRVFGDTPAGQSADPLPDSVYLWQSHQKLFGTPAPCKDQSKIGSCVSFGTNTAVTRTMAVQLVQTGGQADQFRDIAEEVTYGGSRVQIGGGKIRGDGSVGAWAAKFVQGWGVVSRETHGSYNLSVYSVSRCRDFGQKGCPAELEPVSKEHPIKDITLVKNWPDAKRALASGYGIAVCSGQGFAMQRDANGICRASGSWAHCMSLDGYATINGKEYGHIVNSWGANAHTGPVGPGNPPTSGFYADFAVVARMLGEGDSWAFSAVQGWPSRKLDWFVQHSRPGPRLARTLEKEVHYASLP